MVESKQARCRRSCGLFVLFSPTRVGIAIARGESLHSFGYAVFFVPSLLSHSHSPLPPSVSHPSNKSNKGGHLPISFLSTAL